jgi:ElaB/YqjD/DUF883 family membrane-anchored ribosome-binding protein
MTEEERTGVAPSAAPTDGLQELTDEIGQTREELGETVEALVAKADVTARAREKATEVAGRISGKASQVRETAGQLKEQGTARLSSAGTAAPEPVRRAARQAASRVQQRKVLAAMTAAGALLAGWLIVRRRGR